MELVGSERGGYSPGLGTRWRWHGSVTHWNRACSPSGGENATGSPTAITTSQGACLLIMAVFYLSVMVSGKQNCRRAGR